jgi:5'-deoxynucleotidase YfbR-like HD superfamily hydrolase
VNDRKGKWFPIYSGRKIWPLDFRDEDVDIHDIATGLSRIGRFNGHTTGLYSVAQHSTVGAFFIREDCRMAFLLHDAAEAYLGDVISPVKSLLGDTFDNLESPILATIYRKFGVVLNDEQRAEVKRMDRVMLATEVRDITQHGLHNGELPAPLDVPLKPCKPEEARAAFLLAFNKLYYGGGF